MNFINRELELITIWPSQKILQFFNNLRFRVGDLLFAYLLLTLNSIEYNLLLTSNKGRLICYCPLLWEGHKLLLTNYITVLVRLTYCCKWRTDLKKKYIYINKQFRFILGSHVVECSMVIFIHKDCISLSMLVYRLFREISSTHQDSNLSIGEKSSWKSL